MTDRFFSFLPEEGSVLAVCRRNSMTLEFINFSLSISTRPVKGVFQNVKVCFFMFFLFKKKKKGMIKLANGCETFKLQKRFLSLHTFLPPACRQEVALPTHLTDLSLPSLTVLYFYVEINE